MKLALLLVAAVACTGPASRPGMTDMPDPDHPASPEFRSGTRIRAVVDHTGDAALFVGWHDTELDIDCAWVAAGDGVIRCVPAQDPSSGLVFPDGSCKQPPLYQIPQSREPPPMILRPADDMACHGWQVVRLGDEVDLTAVYADASSAIAPVSSSCAYVSKGGPPMRYFALGDTVDPSAFVAAQVRTEPRGQRLKADVLLGDDQSLDARSIFDATRKMHCDPSLDADPANRCLPHFVASVAGWYASCSAAGNLARQEESGAEAFCGEAAQTVQWFSADWRGTAHRTYLETAPYAGGAYTFWTNTCFSASGTFFTVPGGVNPVPLDPSVFAPVSALAEGQGRVGVIAAAASSGERLRSSGFVDSQTGRCVSTLAADGQLRCLPQLVPSPEVTSRYQLSLKYADPNCTAPVLEAASTDLDQTVPELLARQDPRVTPPVTHVYRLASEPTPASAASLFSLDGQGRCLEARTAADLVYATTSEVGPETFAPITRLQE